MLILLAKAANLYTNNNHDTLKKSVIFIRFRYRLKLIIIIIIIRQEEKPKIIFKVHFFS